MHEVQYWSGNCCYARNSIAQRIEIFSTSTARSNLDIFWLISKHWIRLIQSYKYVFQSIWDNQRAYVDSNGKRTTTREGTIIQRSKSSKSQLLNQTSIFFNYFWSIELDSIRATIMPFKVCKIVSASKSIQAKKDDDSWAIKSIKFFIFLNAIAASNLRIFRRFLKRWSHLDRLYDSCHRKYWARDHLVKIRSIWWIDRKHMTNHHVKMNRHQKNWEHHMLIWRSEIRDKTDHCC